MPICFPKLENSFEGDGRVVGFGETKNGSKGIRDVSVSIVAENVCNDSDLNVNDESFCAIIREDERNISKDDSGKFRSQIFLRLKPFMIFYYRYWLVQDKK